MREPAESHPSVWRHVCETVAESPTSCASAEELMPITVVAISTSVATTARASGIDRLPKLLDLTVFW